MDERSSCTVVSPAGTTFAKPATIWRLVPTTTRLWLSLLRRNTSQREEFCFMLKSVNVPSFSIEW